MKMKMVRVLSLLLVFILLFASCTTAAPETPSTEEPSTETPSTEEPSTETPETTGGSRDIVIAVNNNFITLDTHDSRDSLTNGANALMAEGLLEYDKELQLQPCLAESFEISEDGTTYSFKLRQGIKFADGTDFNAEAVKFNVDRVMDPETALRQTRTFADLKEMTTPDEYTIVFQLNQPYMAFASRLESFKIISPKSITDLGKEGLAKQIIGTGPFTFVEWIEGDRLQMKKNEDHRNADQINLDSITYRFITENGTRVAMLQSGEADIIVPMPSEMISQVESDDKIVVYTADSTVCRYVTMNQNVKPLDDVNVRKAMNHAIDKEAFIKVVKGGYGNALKSAMSPVLPFYTDHEAYEYDLVKAKQLLTDAGYPDGFEITLWGNTETETVKGMNFISQQLKEIGIIVDVVPMEEGTLSDSVYNTTPETTKLQMWYVSWSAVDPDNAVRSTFKSDMVPPTGANTNYYNSPVVDTAIENGNKSTTFDDQYKYYKEAQDQIWEDAVWMFMGIDKTVVAKRSHITGAEFSGNGAGIDLREVGVE